MKTKVKTKKIDTARFRYLLNHLFCSAMTGGFYPGVIYRIKSEDKKKSHDKKKKVILRCQCVRISVQKKYELVVLTH